MVDLRLLGHLINLVSSSYINIFIGLLFCFDSLRLDLHKVRSHNNHLQIVFEIRFLAVTPNNVGIANLATLVNILGSRLYHFEDCHQLIVYQVVATATTYIEQDRSRTTYRTTIQQGCIQRIGSGHLSTILARSATNAHMRTATVSHNSRHVGKIDIRTRTFDRNNLGNTLSSRRQNLVGQRHSIVELHICRQIGNMVAIDNEQRVNHLSQLIDAVQRLLITQRALITHRRSDDSHREQTHFARQLGNHGRGSRTRSTTHRRSDKDHLGRVVLKVLLDYIKTLDCGTTTLSRIVASTLTARSKTHLQLDRTDVKCLLVGVTHHIIDILDA